MKKFSIIRATAFSILVTGSVSSFAQSGNYETISFTTQDIENYKLEASYSPKWEPIKEENIAWKKRVWRSIDLSDKDNQLLALSSVHPSIGDVLINGAFSGAFGKPGIYTTDRFPTELKEENIQSLKDRGLAGSQVTSLQIKEDWIFLKGEKKMIVRIVAMAPVVKKNGKDEPVFWIYYPDARSYLATQLVAAPGTEPSNLDQVFEGRFFTSKIIMTSEDMKKK